MVNYFTLIFAPFATVSRKLAKLTEACVSALPPRSIVQALRWHASSLRFGFVPAALRRKKVSACHVHSSFIISPIMDSYDVEFDN